MDGIDWGVYLPMLKTLSLPLLLFVGKWLKGQSWVTNKAIPGVVLALNGAGWILLNLGLVRATDGQLAPIVPPPDPGVMGMGASFVPLYATLAFALPGWLGGVAGTVASVAVEQFLVNRAHKGIKYRALFKLAERTGVIPPDHSKGLRLKSRW
jgi:hypothetical protein